MEPIKPTLVLDPSWEMVDGPYNPPAFMKKGRANNNAFQISSAWNDGGKSLGKSITTEVLARDLVVRRLNGVPLREYTGRCRYGEFTSVIFSAQTFAHCQVWCVSNGIHIISATFICDWPPTQEELEEVEGMALSLHFKEPLPKTKRWWL